MSESLANPVLAPRGRVHVARVSLLAAGFVVVILPIAIYAWVMWPIWTFPDVRDVETVLQRAESEPDAATRGSHMARLMQRLRFAESDEMDRVVAFALEQLDQRYNQSKDAAVLQAFEDTYAFGAFGELMCRRYAGFAADPAFWKRFDESPDVRMRSVELLELGDVSPSLRLHIAEALKQRGIGFPVPVFKSQSRAQLTH